MATSKWVVTSIALIVFCAPAFAQKESEGNEPNHDKVVLQEPQQISIADEIKGMPDGILRVKTNEDGTFRSLLVKATVEIEDVLGGQKGKRLAHKEAEIQCKRQLAQWLEENCIFIEASDKTTTIITKGESTKDAAGNTVKIRTQEGKEYKVLSENHAAVATACLRGLVALYSEVTSAKPPEYVLVLGLSQKSISQSQAVKDALSGVVANPQPTSQPAQNESPDSDAPAAETKVSPDLEDFR